MREAVVNEDVLKLGVPSVALVPTENQKVGQPMRVISPAEALRIAQDEGLDLVCVAPTADPPVCKVADYGKYRYEQIRKEKEAKKNQHASETKEIRMSPNIGGNDIKTKVAAARKFLERGDKVKLSVRFRGREIAYVKNGEAVLKRFAAELADISESSPNTKLEGRFLSVILTPPSKK